MYIFIIYYIYRIFDKFYIFIVIYCYHYCYFYVVLSSHQGTLMKFLINTIYILFPIRNSPNII